MSAIVDIFKIIYTAFGGLAIFFYGMRNMTDGLQAMSGTLIKRIISSLTTNRFLAVLVGLGVTTIIQSSSITTVMTVGFVNSGLMTLTQAIGIIFGANIGTTITGWIISVKVGKYGLLIIALSLYPALYAKSARWRQIGQAVFGVGLIFFGLTLMSGAFKPLRTYPGFVETLHFFSGQTYVSYLACIVVGCILTMIIQSSSAMLGITIALATSGVIEFHTAAALVLGENIGTTITALLASVGGNITAKRAARAHAGFNLFGVGVMALILPYYIHFVEWLVPGAANLIDGEGNRPNVAYHIASSHTIFNVTATLLFVPFLNQFSRLIERITPAKPGEEEYHITLMGDIDTVLPATALIQAQGELKVMKGLVDKLFILNRSYLDTNMASLDAQTEARRMEEVVDNLQQEITVYLVQVMEKPMSGEQSKQAQAIVRIADELESLADYLYRLVKHSSRIKEEGAMKGTLKEEFFALLDEIKAYYDAVAAGIENSMGLPDTDVHRTSDEIKEHINRIREGHVSRASKREYSPSSALAYSDMVVSLRKIRAHTLNIAQAYV